MTVTYFARHARRPWSRRGAGVALVLCLAAVLLAAVVAWPRQSSGEILGSASRFTPLPPTRVLDTRAGGGPVAPGGHLDLGVLGAGGIPNSADVVAVAMNVTIVDATGPGYLQVLPTGRADFGAFSNLNVEYPGQTVPNAAIVPVGNGGAVTFYTTGGGHVLADVVGYFSAAAAASTGRYVAVTPTRALDTRSEAPGKLGAGQAINVALAGRAGVPPSGVSAVVLNVTATEATGRGYVQVIPTDGQTALRTSSNLNVEAGETRPNQVIVQLGANGSITVFSEAGTHLLIDVFGYFTDSSAPTSVEGLFVPIRPVRLLETRGGPVPGAGSLTPLALLGREGIPAVGVAAVIGNLTATGAITGGYLQLVPGPAATAPVGSFSNVNIGRPDQTIANASIANIGTDNTTFVYANASTHVLFDAGGFFTRGTAPPPPTTTGPPPVGSCTGNPVPANAVKGVVGLHGQSGGPNPDVGFGSGSPYDTPGSNYTVRYTQAPFPTGDGGYDWHYDTSGDYQASLAAIQSAAGGLTAIIIHGYSSGGGMALAMYAHGETLGGHIIGYIFDDPAFYPSSFANRPPGVRCAIYGTKDSSGNWNINDIGPGDAMEQLAASLGVQPILNAGYTTHHPIQNPPQIAQWFS